MQRLRSLIVKAIYDYDRVLGRDFSGIKFVFSMKDNTIEEIFTHNELLCHINNSEEDNLIKWKFKAITSHEGPLRRSKPSYNGSLYNSE